MSIAEQFKDFAQEFIRRYNLQTVATVQTALAKTNPGLKVDDVWGPVTQAAAEQAFMCGMREPMQPPGAPSNVWPIKDITYEIRTPPPASFPLKLPAMLEIIDQRCEEIAAVCDFRIRPHRSRGESANLVIDFMSIDVHGRTLADCMVGPNSRRQCQMRINTAHVIDWEIALQDGIDFGAVWHHEVLHAMSCYHDISPEEALLDPVFNPRVLHMMPQDKKDIVQKYGPAIVAPAPEPKPTPGGTDMGGLFRRIFTALADAEKRKQLLDAVKTIIDLWRDAFPAMTAEPQAVVQLTDDEKVQVEALEQQIAELESAA